MPFRDRIRSIFRHNGHHGGAHAEPKAAVMQAEDAGRIETDRMAGDRNHNNMGPHIASVITPLTGSAEADPGALQTSGSIVAVNLAVVGLGAGERQWASGAGATTLPVSTGAEGETGKELEGKDKGTKEKKRRSVSGLGMGKIRERLEKIVPLHHRKEEKDKERKSGYFGIGPSQEQSSGVSTTPGSANAHRYTEVLVEEGQENDTTRRTSRQLGGHVMTEEDRFLQQASADWKTKHPPPLPPFVDRAKNPTQIWVEPPATSPVIPVSTAGPSIVLAAPIEEQKISVTHDVFGEAEYEIAERREPERQRREQGPPAKLSKIMSSGQDVNPETHALLPLAISNLHGDHENTMTPEPEAEADIMLGKLVPHCHPQAVGALGPMPILAINMASIETYKSDERQIPDVNVYLARLRPETVFHMRDTPAATPDTMEQKRAQIARKHSLPSSSPSAGSSMYSTGQDLISAHRVKTLPSSEPAFPKPTIFIPAPLSVSRHPPPPCVTDYLEAPLVGSATLGIINKNTLDPYLSKNTEDQSYFPIIPPGSIGRSHEISPNARPGDVLQARHSSTENYPYIHTSLARPPLTPKVSPILSSSPHTAQQAPPMFDLPPALLYQLRPDVEQAKEGNAADQIPLSLRIVG